MDSLDRPLPAPRTRDLQRATRGYREAQPDRGYSSSEGEGESPADCLDKSRGLTRAQRDDLGINRGSRHRRPNQDDRINGTDRQYSSGLGSSDHRGTTGPGSARLYSYLSGSEGEADPSGPRPSSRQRRRARQSWSDRRSASSSCSSLGESVTPPSDFAPERLGGAGPGIGRGSQAHGGDSEVYNEYLKGRTTDTLTSSGTGVYSRIRDSNTGMMPVLPPPPGDNFSPGPAVPPRQGGRAWNNSSAQTLERQARYGRERDSDGQYNQYRTSGNDIRGGCPTVPTFPRTVPRTISFPRDPRDPQNRMSFADNPNQGAQMSPSIPPPSSEMALRGISGLLPERVLDHSSVVLQDRQQQQQVVTTFNSHGPSVGVAGQRGGLPPYPSVHNEFRDYSSPFSSMSYKVKKHLQCRKTWKCATLVLLSIVAILVSLISYLIVLKVYNLTWGLTPRNAQPSDAYDPSLALDPSKDMGAVIYISYVFGRAKSISLGPYQISGLSFNLNEPTNVKYNLSVPRGALIGVYGRRNVPPTHVQYDFVNVIDGDKVIASAANQNSASKDSKGRQKRSSQTPGYNVADSVFSHRMQKGVWYVGLYNDGSKPNQKVTFQAARQDDAPAIGESCQGRGDLVGGKCQCYPGYDGPKCSEKVCPAVCFGNGLYQGGSCKCFRGWGGKECSLPSKNCDDPECGGNGRCVDGLCICSPGYMGSDCTTEVCDAQCIHGRCHKQKCSCDEGWSGATCDELVCDSRCSAHGFCTNGTCSCQPGWNGRHCTINGCPNSCSHHGGCQLFHNSWVCICHDGWKGAACNVAMEAECDSGVDEDEDGLTDCLDPDCCVSRACRDSAHCRTAPDPMEILLRKQPPSTSASFYDKMRFLIEDDSVQSYATLSSFNYTQVSVIRGKVTMLNGSPLIGVRVSVLTQPLYGFTLTRDQGLFDMLVNGGGSVTLQFQRQPFKVKKVTVMVPWNRMVRMEEVVLVLENEQEPVEEQCSGTLHDHYSTKPVVFSTWQHTQLEMCPSKSLIIPESQVLQETLRIPSTDMYLVYHSSESSGYLSTLLILLTNDSMPSNLATVKLRILVEGLLFEKEFEAEKNLKYRFAWDRRNAYNQKVYGIVVVNVHVGYQYSGCERIFWEMKISTMSSFDMSASDIGGWNIHLHHTYNIQEGILYRGDGSNIYTRQKPRKVVTVLGDGRQRRVDCRGCDGRARENRVMAPVALAGGRDGSVYVGDYNHIRRLSPGRDDITSILQLNMPDLPYKYFMTVSPKDGRLYVADYQGLKIIRVKTMGSVRDLAQNFEVIAGTGEQCIPGDKQECGDGGPAISAKLFYPKGIAIDKDGVVYFADGTNIRTIDELGQMNTLIGSQGQPKHWQPLPCRNSLSTEEISLRWPTSLAVNPTDNTLHILDNNIVLQLTHDHRLIIVAGRPLHCPSTAQGDPEGGRNGLEKRRAVDVVLEHPQHISFSPDGVLYIVESNDKDINRVRTVDSAGYISHFAGKEEPTCNCRSEDCRCFIDSMEQLAMDFPLDSPTALTVTPDGVVHIADMGNLRVHSVVTSEPSPDKLGQFEVEDAASKEIYIFNRYGQHVATRNAITDSTLYTFTYNTNSHYGKLTKVTDGSGNSVTVRRDYKLLAKELLTPDGGRSRLGIDTMGQLQSFVPADNVTTRFSYLGNSGLLESRESSDGSLLVYDYDDIGHVTGVATATGEKISLNYDVTKHGVVIDVIDPSGAIQLTTSGEKIELSSGNSSAIRMAYSSRGTLSADYHTGAGLSLKTSLLHSTSSRGLQVQQQRRLLGPGDSVHESDWLGYLRYMSSSKRSEPEKLGQKLKVNGREILMLEYDTQSNTQTVYAKGQDKILSISYNPNGYPVYITTPSGAVEALNVTYDHQGRITLWRWGEMSTIYEYYEKTGRLMERKLGNRVTYRYIYKNGENPTDVILPSGKQVQLHYDDYGNLHSITMPNLARHIFHSLSTIGVRRQIYHAPNSHGSFVRDFNGAGQLIKIFFPSGYRRITFQYKDHGKETIAFYDWSELHEFRPIGTADITSAYLIDQSGSGFYCRITYIKNSSLVVEQRMEFSENEDQLKNASFHYSYDSRLQLSSVGLQINDRIARTVEYKYDEDTGLITHVGTFVFSYPRVHREIVRDVNVEITRDFDRYGRQMDVWYRFNNYVVYTLEVKYDALGRVYQWRRKVGSSDLKPYEYLYDIDGAVAEVLVSGQSTWKYETDANSNIVKITHYGNSHTIVINTRDQVESSGPQRSYIFDRDGFLVRRGDKETFEYDSFGRLHRAFEPGRYDNRYHYDVKHRLTSLRDVRGGQFNFQYFYSDVSNPQRVTHEFDNVKRIFTEFYYDRYGKLFSMRRGRMTDSEGGDFYYIGLDPNDSPLVILNSVGSVVKLMEYDPLGVRIGDSAPEFSFPFGFQGGIYDQAVGMVFLPEGRVYDPEISRWTVPDYGGLLDNLYRVAEFPEMVNLYRYPYLWKGRTVENFMLDERAWLTQLGYDFSQLLPSLDFSGRFSTSSSLSSSSSSSSTYQHSLPIVSTFECAFKRDITNFLRTTTVQSSKLTLAPESASLKIGPTLAPIPYIFGSRVIVSISAEDSKVRVEVLDGASDRLALLASTLLNNSISVAPMFTIHGRDTHHFVRPDLSDASDDIKRLELRVDTPYVEGVNVSIHAHRDRSTDVIKYVDVHIRSDRTVVTVRYGDVASHERVRVLRHAQIRAVEAAWAVERELAQSGGERTGNKWSPAQKSELLSKGIVASVTDTLRRDDVLDLYDDPKNIRFVSSQEDNRGKR